MAIIDNKNKAMRKIEDEDIERYGSMAKERAGKRGT